METLTPKADTPANEKSTGSPTNHLNPETTEKPVTREHHEGPGAGAEQILDAEAELAKLESEFGKVGPDYPADEIGDWEFDELERELRSGDSANSK